MEIGFENVMLSDESREVAAHISDYIAKKLVKNSDTVVKIIVSMSQKQHQQLMSILIFWSRGGLTLPSECLVTYVCDCFAFADHDINVITSSKMKERTAAEHLLNVVIFHEPFLCSVHWSKGQSITHRIIANIHFNNKRKIMTGSVHKDNVVSFKRR